MKKHVKKELEIKQKLLLKDKNIENRIFKSTKNRIK